MALFQNSVLKKYLKALATDVNIQNAYKEYSAYFHNSERQENIRNSKEEQFQEGFLRELFVKVLGYTINPEPDFNLTTELKNQKDSKKADAAILSEGLAIGIIELKGMNTTDLGGKVELQAFSYKNNHQNVSYIITSNFEKLRFYIDNAIEFEEFNLFQLDWERFQLLWLLLAKKNLFESLARKMKNESSNAEAQITKFLYDDYSAFKREVFQNIQLLNPEFEPLLLFSKTQKLLDRFLFIFFAEDRQLLASNSIRGILNQWQNMKGWDYYTPLYEHFKKYFGFLAKGIKNEVLDVYAYNGGLFAPDEVLDVLKIDDALLFKHSKKLSEYDFESEVDVNILGHIFENSLNELDEIKASLEGGSIEKSQTKRKKDGVFYTPRYITKYIVDNTLGRLCLEKRPLLPESGLSPKMPKKEKEKWLHELKTYRDWLLQITICDPACGSGAFLNEAMNFLMEEHRYIDELQAKLFGDAMMLSDVKNSILENNLFGVDINDESVEIAKLSLWLRSAEPNRKLNDLNNNIKCGNSLIDDPAIAGEKAFSWEKEFPQVFAKGGFDVIIGNPPYVKLEGIREASEALEKIGYKTFDKRGDLYVLFVEKGFALLKHQGILSYIMPNKWLQAGYGEKLRSYFLTKQLEQLIDFGDIQIFEGATTYPVIFIANNDVPAASFKAALLKKTEMVDFTQNVLSNLNEFNTSEFSGDTWVISSNQNKDLLERLSRNFQTLEKTIGGEAYYGIKTGLTEAFVIDSELKDKLIAEDIKSLELIKPFLLGRDISPYDKNANSAWLILIPKGFTIKKNLPTDNPYHLNEPEPRYGNMKYDDAWAWFSGKYPAIAKYLLQFKLKLENRTDKGDYWWELRACDYYDKFSQPKIMYQKFQVKPCFIYDETGLFCNDSMWIIPTENKGLLAVLNSKMGWWLITKYCTQIQNGCQLIWKYFGQIPMPSFDKEHALYQKAETMLSLHQSLQKLQHQFLSLLQGHFSTLTINNKLEEWQKLSFKEFIKELEKQKIKPSLKEQMDWQELFEAQKEKAADIQKDIAQTDRAIDKIVYELYGLSAEEIQLVEEGGELQSNKVEKLQSDTF